MKKIMKRIIGLMLMATVLVGSLSIEQLGTVFEVHAAEEVQFAGYKKLGDTITVENAEAGSDYVWTVTSQITGQVVDTITNSTGTLVTSDDYDECMIKCEVGSEVLSMYCSSLPVMYIDSDTPYGSVDDEEYSDVNIKLVGSEMFSDEDLWYDGEAEIKLRGNSTANRPKSPYRVKLGSKADLLGLGKGEESKHWVLLANDIDHSLIRNKLLYDFSGAIGTEFYFDSTNISVVYNGDYIGVYQLCEHRRVDEGRIDITDWVGIGEDAAEAIADAEYDDEWAAAGYSKASKLEDAINEVMYQDYSWMDTGEVTLDGTTFKFEDYGIELPEATGGFLAEMDFYSMGSDAVASIETAYGQPLYFSAPEAGSDAADIFAGVRSFKQTDLFTYALKYTQSFEYAIHSADFVFESGTHKAMTGDNFLNAGSGGWTSVTSSVQYTDTDNDGKHYSEMFDMDSLVTNFVFVEYAMNWDSMKNSFFFYKDIDELAKIGPQWDFDWSLGNINMYNINTWFPESWQTTNEMYTREQAYQSYNWNRLLIKDPYFLVRVYEKYHNIRDIIEEMVKDGGTIDQYAEYLAKAGLANDARWEYTYTDYWWYSGGWSEDFVTSIDSLKTFLNTRVKWLDEQFASIDDLVNSLGYYQEAEDIDVTYDVSEDGTTVAAVVTNDDCKKVAFQVNGTYMVEADVVDGLAMATIPTDALVCDGVTMNVVVAYEVDEDGEYILNTSLKPSDNYEYIAKSAYAVFVMDDNGLAGEQEKTGAVVTEGKKLQSEGERTEKYKLVGDGSISIDVKVTSDSKYLYNYMWAEVVDSNNNYFTTVSDGDAWFYSTWQDWDGIFVEEGDYYQSLIKGHTYRITLTRNGQELSVEYYDLTDDEVFIKIVGEPWYFDFSNTLYFHIVAQNSALQIVETDGKESLNVSDISLDETVFEYDGEAKEPEVEVSLNGQVVDDSNYTTTYYNNVDAGLAVVYISANKDSAFKGTAMKVFSIVEAEDETTEDTTDETVDETTDDTTDETVDETVDESTDSTEQATSATDEITTESNTTETETTSSSTEETTKAPVTIDKDTEGETSENAEVPNTGVESITIWFIVILMAVATLVVFKKKEEIE